MVTMQQQTWAIFCRVVDNYGDIGVCWRLARQLANEFALDVTLWVDDLASFAQIRPDLNPQLASQSLEGVTVRHWVPDFPRAETAADVVIEAFACEIPAAYLAQMQARSSAPVWINLEYLSAEDWVEGCHGLPSPQAGLQKYFFFPGFTTGTGGLFSELQQRELQLGWGDEQGAAFIRQLIPALATRQSDQLLISLFAYEPEGLEAWLALLALQTQLVHLIVPQGRVLLAMNLDDCFLWQCVDGVYQQGSLRVYPISMLSQDDYDRLLLSCDINFVRGEDSFMRAQWAAQPFIWHIYPQQEDAHLEKLAAFLHRYLADAPADVVAATAPMMQVWNQGGALAPAWQALLANRTVLAAHARQWREKLIELGDLATNLVRFANSKVK
jgi:uncharacterized repeat protein (TIGR03837 family)